jgi:hypothetical protein
VLYPQSANTLRTSAATVNVSRRDRTLNKYRREMTQILVKYQVVGFCGWITEVLQEPTA